MRNSTSILLITFALFACSKEKQYDLAIQNVKVFNSIGKSVVEGKTILIVDDTIAAILDTTQKISAKKVIEGNERLIVPGFIDTHVHLRQMLDLTSRNAPEILDSTYIKKLTEKCLSYGTTTVLDMGQYESWMKTTIQWQKNPLPNFPNYFITGAAMISDLGQKNPAPHHVIVKNPVEKVKEYHEIGSGYIKLYSHLNLEDMEVIAKEAIAKDINMFAHTDNNRVTIQQAMDLGVRNFEHFFTVIPSTLTFDPHWGLMEKSYQLSGVIDHIDDFTASMVFFFGYIKKNPELEKKLLALFDEMAAKDASISTTLHVLGAVAGQTSFFSSFNHFPIRNAPSLTDYSVDHKAALKEAFQTMMEYVKIAHDKGVKIRMGTDNREAGQAMISEFLLLYEAGFSVEDILQIATWNGATTMRQEAKIGAIEIGKKADLVLFDKDPFENYKNFASELTIIKGGKEFEPLPNVIDTTLQLIKTSGIEKGIEKIESSISMYAPYELLEIGYHLLHIGNIDEGFQILDFTSSKFPNMKKIFYEDAIKRVGVNLYNTGEQEKGKRLFEFNTKKFPTSAEAFSILGEVYMALENNELAIEYYEKALKLDPENEEVIEALNTLRE